MTTLHMETDSVRAMAAQIKQAAESMRSQMQALNGSAQSVDWMGPSRDEFVAEVEGLIRQIDGQAEAGMVLAQRVENEVAEWQQTAASFVPWEGSSVGTDAMSLVGFAGLLGIGKVKTPDLSSISIQLGKTSAGKDLLNQAEKARLTFRLPDGTKVGYAGKGGRTVDISYGNTEKGVLGYADSGNNKIVISSNNGLNDRSQREVMAHEMQHALDYRQNLVPSQPKMPSVSELQKMSDEKRQELANTYAKWYEGRLDSEHRAWERGHSVNINDEFDLKKAFRTRENIFTDGTKKTYTDGYEAVYESEFKKKIGNGAEIDLSWKDGHLVAKLAVPRRLIDRIPIKYA